MCAAQILAPQTHAPAPPLCLLPSRLFLPRWIKEGKVDIVSMGRKLLADPYLPERLAKDQPEQIRPCIYCYICVAQPFFDRKVRCAVNTAGGNEVDYAELLRSKTAAKKRVLVVGSGPAGLEAASVAAIRGHDVVLCEKSASLGGTLRFAALAYQPNEDLLNFLEARLKTLPVDLRLSCEVTPDLVRELAPDVVLAAVGPRREKSKIPGADQKHVFDGDTLRDLLTGDGASDAEGQLSFAGRVAVRAGRLVGVTSDPSKLRQASKAYMPLGKRVAVIGGGLVGCELAEFMAERGRDVHVFEEGPVLATEMSHPRRWRVLHDLREMGVTLHAETQVVEITADTIRFVAVSGETAIEETPVDTVVIATGLVANSETVESLQAGSVPVIVIGDASGVGYLDGAIEDGFKAAIELG